MRKVHYIILLIFLIMPLTYAETGLNYQTTCQENTCTTTVHASPKYYQRGNEWLPINENFVTPGCADGYTYCTQENFYQSHFPQRYGIPLTEYNSVQLSFDLINIGGFTLTDSYAQVTDNIITYPNVLQGIDIRYTYIPHKIKEEIIIHNRETLANLQNDLQISFELNTFNQDIVEDGGNIRIGDFVLGDFLAYDANDNYLEIPFELSGNGLTLTLDKDWLLSDERIYPLLIDPSIQINVSVSEDLHVFKGLTSTWTRRDSLNHFRVGKRRQEAPLSITEDINRGGIDWDITSIPNDANVLALNLTLYANQEGDTFNENITIVHIEHNSSDYTNNNSDNELYWNDMENGTQYLAEVHSGTGFHSFNLTNAITDFENALSSTDTFSIGFTSINDTSIVSGNISEWRFRSTEASNASRRPVLTVTYAIANESEGDIAIEQGVFNAIPSALLHDEQQVYTRLANSTQELGRFDKFVISENQRWAINYVTLGENYTFMKNISDVFFVLELAGLTAGQIEAQVQAFIEDTQT